MRKGLYLEVEDTCGMPHLLYFNKTSYLWSETYRIKFSGKLCGHCHDFAVNHAEVEVVFKLPIEFLLDGESDV